MNFPGFKLILFDLDDTLVDFATAEDHAILLCWERFFKTIISLECFKKTFRRLNRQIWHEVAVGKLIPTRVSYERARRVFKHFGLRTTHAGELGELFARALGQIAIWLPGAEQGFKRIASRYPVGLITNGLAAVQNPRIDRLGIRSYFRTLQISDHADTLKPRADLFCRAMAEAESNPEQTLMVGDSVFSDFQGAINAGIDFCWVKPDSHPLPLGFPAPRYHVKSVVELDSILA